MVRLLILDAEGARFKIVDYERIPLDVLYPCGHSKRAYKMGLVAWAESQVEPWHKVEDFKKVMKKMQDEEKKQGRLRESEKDERNNS